MLIGERVILRPVRREDLPLLNQYNNDLAVELAGGGDPPMPQSLPRLEAEYEREWSKGGRDDANFIIEVDNTCIGGCALFNFDQTAHTCELGISIGAKEYWGQGLGREAIQLLVHYAFHYRNMHKVYLEVHAKNERAYKAYQAVGFVQEGRLRQQVWSDGAYDDLIQMGILRSEWSR